MPTSISKGIYVDTPPAFCSHFPTLSPMIFSTTATKSSAKEPTSKNVLSCASAAPPDPARYPLIAALAINWKSRRKFIDDHRGRQKEENCRQHPEADRGSTVMGRSSNPARPENCCDVEEKDVPKAHLFS